MEQLQSFLPLILILVIIFFFFIRPKVFKKEREQKQKIIADSYQELTEKQLLVAILKTNRKTSGWITFIGWVVLIGIVFNIIMALGLLSL